MSQIRSFLELPQFETTPEQINKNVDELIAAGKKKTAEMGAQDRSKLSFASTVKALDDLSYEEDMTMSRIYLLQNVSPDENIRKAATEAFNRYQDYAIERGYNLAVYEAVQAYASQKESLSGEEKKLFDETLRDYRRMGFHLPEADRKKLEDLQKKLSTLENDFSTAINDFEDELEVTREELKGLDDSFIAGLKKTTDGKRYRVTLQYPEYHPVMEFCENEDVRRKLQFKKMNTAKDKNVGLLNQMIALRDEIATMIGYKSWNHYVLEERMAKSPERVYEFLNDFEKKLKRKAAPELEELKALKRKDTGDPKADIYMWDYYHYSSKAKKLKYQVDSQALKEYFPLEGVLTGMFSLLGKLFSLQFEEQKKGAFYAWHEDVRLFKVIAKDSQEAMGYFYLDLFPRAGKYGHAAAFGLMDGKLLDDGRYRRPVGCMVCNFPKAAPSLLSHSEVETLFHEFGHVLHDVLTRAKFAKFSGTSVARDFVEAPSQVLENWVWDSEILNMITPAGKKIPTDLVERMNTAKKDGAGLFYLRQLSYAKTDLEFHGPGREKDSTQIMAQVTTQVFLPNPPNTHPNAGFGHMVGYASGYYGYSWADVMAADIFSVFKKEGLLNEKVGLRLRKEIYEPGSSRDENESLEKFLLRPLSSEAFFEDLGLVA